MAFTKEVMQAEIVNFLTAFSGSIQRMYGGDVEGILSSRELILKSPLYTASSEMYDFGIKGAPVAELGQPGETVDASHADAELFVHGIESGAFNLYFEEDDRSSLALPLTHRAIKAAVARHVLEGGLRYTDLFALENDEDAYDCLSLAEVALLADMDERSVRNATNSKLPDPLVTTGVGKRSLVTAAEAKRWLASRKGFVPTQTAQATDADTAPAKTESVALPAGLAATLKRKADAAGLSVEEFLQQQLEEK